MLLEVARRIVEQQPALDGVSEVSDPGELRFAIQATGAQVVIMTATHAEREPGICRDLLTANPQLKIIVLLCHS